VIGPERTLRAVCERRSLRLTMIPCIPAAALSVAAWTCRLGTEMVRSHQIKPQAVRAASGGREGKRNERGRKGASLRGAALAISCVVYLAPLAACGKPKTRFKPALLATENDVREYIHTALEHESADVRRAAVNQLAKVWRSPGPVREALDLSARADSNDAVRCAAIRARARQGDSEAVGTMLAVLDHPAYRSENWSASAKVRWEATAALLDMAAAGGLSTEMNDAVGQTAMRLVSTDKSRDVRLLAARILGYYATNPSLEALIGALRQDDFGVVYESERALTRLTGQTHDHDPAQWRDWLASADDPFANGSVNGEAPDDSPERWWWPW